MSLINDALKRAKQHQPPPAPASTVDIGAPMRPVEPPHRPGSGASTLIVGLIAIVLLLAGAMFYLAGRSSAGPPQLALSTEQANQAVTAAPTITSPTFPSAPNAATPLAEQPVATNLTLSSPKPPETVASVPPAPTIVTQVIVIATNVPTTPPMTIKLQGLFYRPSQPSAMINGRTVVVGERVGDARVLAITQTNVSVLQNGLTNVLSLE